MAPPAQPDTKTRAAQVLRSLRAGVHPDSLGVGEGDDLSGFGPWREGILVLRNAFLQDGDSGVEQAYIRLTRMHAAWIALQAAAPADAPATTRTMVPTLPPSAQAVDAVTEPAGSWLDQYLTWSQQAVPMAPASFHEAAGLFLASVAVARRCHFQNDTATFYPNLWFLLLAPPGRYRKSSTLDLCTMVGRAAGLGPLLMETDKSTPEGLVDELNPEYLPDKFPRHKAEEYLGRRRWANTKGWVRDEVQSVFQSVRREYNAELLTMLLSLYNGKPFRQRTRGRGEEVIPDPYLPILSASTPGAMHPHLANREHWDSGLWSRFILLQPETDSVWSREQGGTEPPADLVRRLRALRDLFPEPQAELREDPKTKEPYVHWEGAGTVAVAIEPAAYEAWTAYREACEYTFQGDPDQGGAPEMLQATYIRFPGVAIRIAVLLAALDSADAGVPHRQITIEVRHYARAQRIVERYRAGVHKFFESNVRTEESEMQGRIIQRLTKAAPRSMTAHDLCEALRVKARDMSDALILLSRSGLVARIEDQASNGKKVERWTVTSLDLRT